MSDIIITKLFTQSQVVYCVYLYSCFGKASSFGEVFTYERVGIVSLFKDLFKSRQLTTVERRSTTTWLCLSRCRCCRRRCLCRCRSHPDNVLIDV